MKYMIGFYSNLIGKSLGKVLEEDVDEDDIGWRLFLKFRLEINLEKPLTCGRSLEVKGKSLWIPIKYEKLPHFCFSCGRILHSSECNAQNGNNEKNQFSAWLRIDYQKCGGFNSSTWERKDK